MFKKLVWCCLLACSLPALADSWDSRGNIAKATEQAIQTYKTKGADALVADGESCHAGLDLARTNKNLARDVEYCIAFEIAATLIDQKTANPHHPYWANGNTFLRGMYALERARIVTLPEQFNPYLERFKGIPARVNAAL